MKRPSEARRALTRIGTNYVRLGISVVLGLAVVPLLLGRVGSEAYGLIGLLGSTIGIAALLQDVVKESMVRELGAAYHRDAEAAPGDAGSAEPFVPTYNGAVLLCLAISGLTALLFAGVWLAVPLLRIPPDLIGAARWLVVANGLETTVVIASAPAQRMYLVTERMVLANLWLLSDRVSRFIAVMWIISLAAGLARPEALVLYAWIASSIMILLVLTSSAVMMVLEPVTVPRPAAATRRAMRSLLTIGGYNTMTQLANHLHLRFGQILMNLFLGLHYNAVFAIAIVLASYTRMVATGMTGGVDAVAARLSTRAGHGQMRVLLRHSTRLHALVALPVAAVVLFLAEAVIEVWLGRRLPNPAAAAMTANLARLVVLGVTARAIGDGWLKILYGAGHINRYARAVIGAGVATPIGAVILLWALPDPAKYLGPAISFSIVVLTLNLAIIPPIAARALGLTVSDVLTPVLRPAVATLGIVPLLAGARLAIVNWNLVSLGAVGVATAAVYAGLTWAIVVAPDERQRIRNAIGQRLRLAH